MTELKYKILIKKTRRLKNKNKKWINKYDNDNNRRKSTKQLTNKTDTINCSQQWKITINSTSVLWL